MHRTLVPLPRRSIVWSVLAAGAVAALAAGCGTVDYYRQSVVGHLGIVGSARPVSDWLADAGAPAALKERLHLAQRIRDFAVSELKLPDNASYRRYADLRRPAAVWNVVSAPELSLKLNTSCFPLLGCVGYRGYFARTDADAQVAALHDDGMEVAVYPVPAYSTLGMLPGDFFSDPLLSTFIQYPEGQLARMIFHELAHQAAYASGDTMFNESFATAVERIGARRWLAGASEQARAEYAAYEARQEDFRALTGRTREALDALYRSEASKAEKRRGKAALMQQMRDDHEALKRGSWNGYAGYDAWFAHANNASLGVLAAYDALVPQFERLFERQGGDFTRFYAEVRRLAALPKVQRAAALAAG